MDFTEHNRRKLGAEQEMLAADYLRRKGYMILEKNYRTRIGEIDLIALDGGTLVFVEVKFRSGRRYGAPGEAVDHRKQATIYRVAEQYMHHHGYLEDAPCRFDVIAITGTRIEHIENAFGGL